MKAYPSNRTPGRERAANQEVVGLLLRRAKRGVLFTLSMLMVRMVEKCVNY